VEHEFDKKLPSLTLPFSVSLGRKRGNSKLTCLSPSPLGEGFGVRGFKGFIKLTSVELF
jgi:hypothetical protein